MNYQEFDPENLSTKEFYKLISGTIIPRPIGWISTINENGQANLAPFSFFNAVCSNPPTLLFCSSIRGTDGSEKDTLQNIRANREFVVNIVSTHLLESMNKSATELPADINEFRYSNLTELPSKVIAPPRVGESYVNIECKLSQIVDIGEGDVGAGSIVIGQVVYLHIDNKVMLPNFKINTSTLDPLGRLAGPNYGGIGKIFQLSRETSKITKK